MNWMNVTHTGLGWAGTDDGKMFKNEPKERTERERRRNYGKNASMI